MVNSTVFYPEPLYRMTKGWEPVHSTPLLTRCSQERLLHLAFALCSINGSCIYAPLACLDNGNRVNSDGKTPTGAEEQSRGG